jgi:hypothetical protein
VLFFNFLLFHYQDVCSSTNTNNIISYIQYDEISCDIKYEDKYNEYMPIFNMNKYSQYFNKIKTEDKYILELRNNVEGTIKFKILNSESYFDLLILAEKNTSLNFMIYLQHDQNILYYINTNYCKFNRNEKKNLFFYLMKFDFNNHPKSGNVQGIYRQNCNKTSCRFDDNVMAPLKRDREYSGSSIKLNFIVSYENNSDSLNENNNNKLLEDKKLIISNTTLLILSIGIPILVFLALLPLVHYYLVTRPKATANSSASSSCKSSITSSTKDSLSTENSSESTSDSGNRKY